MFIGASTASLYPMATEKALLVLAKLGIKNIELFINCETELHNPLRAEISKIIREYSLNIVSVHPVTVTDTFYLFSNYERRLEAFLKSYTLYFECAKEWGADIIVFHGMKKEAEKSEEFYFERFGLLLKAADEYGVTVSQENVVYCKSGQLDFLEKMKNEFGDRAKFTLDLKQALRSGSSAFDILERLGKSVNHIHISDNAGLNDCLPVGKGNFDFAKFFKLLRKLEYNKSMVLELYRNNYKDYSELADSVEKLKKF